MKHTMGIVNADWVTDAQRAAAEVFVDYVLTAPAQELIMSYGFRPANPDVQLGFPFVTENGIDPAGPRTVLNVPAPDVIRGECSRAGPSSRSRPISCC
jgi:Ca-activated chloride channel family protein